MKDITKRTAAKSLKNITKDSVSLLGIPYSRSHCSDKQNQSSQPQMFVRAGTM